MSQFVGWLLIFLEFFLRPGKNEVVKYGLLKCFNSF